MNKIDKNWYISKLIIFGFMGSGLAVLTFQYDYVANGLLGISAVYFMFFGKSATEEPIDKLITSPNKHKKLIEVSLLAFTLMLSIWAVIKMIRFVF